MIENTKQCPKCGRVAVREIESTAFQCVTCFHRWDEPLKLTDIKMILKIEENEGN